MDDDRKKCPVHFDRHAPEYRHHFEATTEELQTTCPVAWSDTYGGHWVASTNGAVFDLARSAEYLSNDHDVQGERRGYQGISIPAPPRAKSSRGGFLEMDPPEQRHYRQAIPVGASRFGGQLVPQFLVPGAAHQRECPRPDESCSEVIRCAFTFSSRTQTAGCALLQRTW